MQVVYKHTQQTNTHTHKKIIKFKKKRPLGGGKRATVICSWLLMSARCITGGNLTKRDPGEQPILAFAAPSMGQEGPSLRGTVERIPSEAAKNRWYLSRKLVL